MRYFQNNRKDVAKEQEEHIYQHTLKDLKTKHKNLTMG